MDYLLVCLNILSKSDSRYAHQPECAERQAAAIYVDMYGINEQPDREQLETIRCHLLTLFKNSCHRRKMKLQPRTSG